MYQSRLEKKKAVAEACEAAAKNSMATTKPEVGKTIVRY